MICNEMFHLELELFFQSKFYFLLGFSSFPSYFPPSVYRQSANLLRPTVLKTLFSLTESPLEIYYCLKSQVQT